VPKASHQFISVQVWLEQPVAVLDDAMFEPRVVNVQTFYEVVVEANLRADTLAPA
jgi:hypothetical protein